MTAGVYVLSCRLASGPLWLGIYPFLRWFLFVIFGLFLLHWRSELPCQDKLPEFHCTAILGCIRVLWLVFHPLGLRLDKALCGWNSVRKGSKWNVQIEWETGEITFEPLSVIGADDPITCAAYAKEKNLYILDGWKRFRHLIKKEKQLTRAIKQSKIRQVRHAKKYMFGFLIPRNYTEALEFDKANNNSKWYDATKAELDSIHSYLVFQKHEEVINALPGY